MTSSQPLLPWEREFRPAGAPAPQAPAASPEVTPSPPPDKPKADLQAATDALNRAADPMAQSATIGDVHDILSSADLKPAVDAVEKAVEDALRAKMAGKQVVIATTSVSGHQIKFADAKSRAFRTLFQNLGIDLLVALGTVLPMLTTMNFTDKTAWAVFGASVAKTVIAVFVSYVSRLTAEPVIPTPIETPGGQVVQPLPGQNATG